MKPLRLRVQAFGPFASEQEISFSPVSDEGGLFLIHGQTGAGKTSILDAICFALFGKSSGDERKGSGLRCDLADSSVATFAELEFRLGPTDYRVQRSPDQHLKRKRGDGLKKESADATLWVRPPLPPNQTSTDWRVLAAGVKDVTVKIEELLGLGEKQFRQVVILPQGQFRAFLAATSAERETILESLFRTGDYRGLTDALRARFLALESEMKAAANSLKGRLLASGVESVEALAVRETDLDTEASESAAALVASDAHIAVARERFERARAISVATADLHEANRALARLLESEPEATRMSDRKANSERARPVQALIESLRTLERDLDEAEKRYTSANARMSEAQARAAQTPRLENEAEQNENRDRTLSERARGLEESLARAMRVQTAVDTAQRTKNLAESAAHEVAQSKARTETAETAWRAREADVARWTGEATRAESLKSDLALLRARAKAAQTLSGAERDLTRATTLAFERATARDLAMRRAEESELACLSAKARLFAGQAATLAARLQKNSPCPVCGSREHPAPAIRTEAEDTEAQLNTAEREAAAARAHASKALAACAEADGAVRAAEAQVAARHEDVQAHGDDPSPSAHALYERLVAEGLLLSERVKAADRAVLETRSAEAAMVQAKAVAEAAREALARCELRAREIEIGRAEADAKLEALRSELGSIAEPAEIRAELARAQVDAASARAAAAAARTEIASASRAVAEADAAAREVRSQLDAITSRSTLARATLATTARARGFQDPIEAERALLSESQTAEIDRALLERERERASAESGRARAQAALEILGESSVSLDVARSELLESEAKAKAVAESATRAAETLRAFRAQAEAIRSAAANLQTDEHALAAIGRLAKVAMGQPPENATGVSLQRYVLGAQLDLVLERASLRLRRMTRGQFALRRVANREDARKTAGLDIEVEDAFTGTFRPAAFLSGGESFMAALALALGLADIVQEASGGSRFDSVFIDEGFGTLDSEALDLAIRALSDLKGVTGRMVGIISHVPELREQIDRRLFVHRGDRGSRAEWAGGI